MKRVMLYAVAAFAAGIAAQCLQVSGAVLFVYGCFLMFLAFCTYKKKYSAVILCSVIVAAGFLYMGTFVRGLERKADVYAEKDAYVYGRVINLYKSDDSSYIDVKASNILLGGKELKDKTKIRVYLYDYADFKYGDIVEFDAKIKKPTDIIKMAARSNGLLLTCGLSPSKIAVLGNKTSLYNPFDLAYLVREFIKNRTNAFLNGNAAGLLMGILVGDTSGLNEMIKSYFRVCGLSHITAVSGMHVGIVLAIAIAVFSVIRIKKHKISILFYIGIIWLFTLIAGLGASAVRASLMTTIFFISFVIRKDNDALNSLATAVFIMLGVNPAILFDIGFELSVLSTAGIILFEPLLQSKLRIFSDTLAGVIAVTVSAQITTLPVVVYHFGMVSLLGVLANIIICPVIPLIMALGIVLVVFSYVMPVAAAASFALKYILQGAIYTAAIIANAPHATVNMRFEALWILAYIFLYCALYMFLLKKRRTALYLSAISSVILFVGISTSFLGNGAVLSFVNVGKGDCTVFSAPKAVLMFDGGGSYDRDVGRKTVEPFLRRSGISKVDIAFLTHCHTDHALGFVPLLKDGVIKNIVLPNDADRSELGRAIAEAAQIGGANVFYSSGDKQISFCDITVDIVDTSDGEDENNGLVYFLTYGKNRVCITGDINKNAERVLCKRLRNISCNLLKIAHHGSSTSSDSVFLRAIGAKFAVISCAGERSPSSETLETLKREAISYAATKVNGNIEFLMDRKRFKKISLERGAVNEL